MSREEHARAAVQEKIPGDEIIDVALTHPRGFTRTQRIGVAAGTLAGQGMGDGFVGIGAVLGSVAGGKLFANLKELPASIVLAISATNVYTLGRSRQGAFGGWVSIVPMVEFDREHLGSHCARTSWCSRSPCARPCTMSCSNWKRSDFGTLDAKTVLAPLL